MLFQTLHILNGQAMYEYFKKTHCLEQERMVPFNEAMCFGDISGDLFSHEFVEVRAKIHHVTLEQYTENTLKPLEPLLNGDYSNIVLWFDADMFCQINVLTVLAWLDKTAHRNPIKLHIVGDKFEPLEHFTLKAEGYFERYQQVLIHKEIPQSITPATLKKGVELYSNYLKEDSDLIQYIQRHQHLTENDLVSAMIEKFTEYGLGDEQYLEIIKEQRKLSVE
jgi:hypothetical protein